MQKLKLNLTTLLPKLESDDQCYALLTAWLAGVRGVEEAHITRTDGTAELCVHYVPNLVPLAKLQRLAVEAGAKITDRYQHETLPFAGLDAADNANTLRQALEQLPGMLHASVNYAAGLISVAYDREQLNRTTIENTLHTWGRTSSNP